ncbi:MAG: peptidylprolyl isomerase [bacterium]
MRGTFILGIILCFLALGVCFAYSLIDYQRGKIIYVKAPTENLRDAPNGNKIGSLDKGTSLVVLEDSPKWVKVRIEGWIWKGSVTDSRIALRGGGYRALQIIVKDRATAESILKELKAGADFGKLAKDKSIGPAAQRGGDLGYFNKGDFQPEFESVILNLKPGEISEIIQSEFGFHIFKRVE